MSTSDRSIVQGHSRRSLRSLFWLARWAICDRLFPPAPPRFLSPQTHRHAFDLVVAPERITESRLYKKIAYELIFQSPQLQQIEFKGGFILDRLYAALVKVAWNPKVLEHSNYYPKMNKRC